MMDAIRTLPGFDLAFRMVDRLARTRRMKRHFRHARPIEATPPIVPRHDGVVILSMIGTATVLPYLVAVKSFHHHLGMGRVVLLDDGSLTEADKTLLAHHAGSPTILRLADVDRGGCPRGGAWERLLTVLELRAEDYVIQIDSDTVTLGDMPEVRAAIAANDSFILLGGPDAEEKGIQTLPDFVAHVYPHGPVEEPAHIQSLIESRLAAHPDADRYRYIRGCAGFAGFARGGRNGPADASRFSQIAAKLVGDAAWTRWGSEQVASNFLLANEPGARILPYARYHNYWLEPQPVDERFVHFVGTHRYSDDRYIAATDRAIALLPRG
ncbi:hypothetical protein ACQR50_13835 [Sphingomonas sp. Xoc002]|uniref:hypothetical protein n=1 Tax=Sphingomonas sp. Xoc002 TaxID=2837624 RepID=UPI003D178452